MERNHHHNYHPLLAGILAILYAPIALCIALNDRRLASLRHRIETWSQPPDWFLQPAARLVLAIWPIKCDTRLLRRDCERVFYVSNHQLLALELPALYMAIYLHTGKVPRGILDRIHLKIPIWADYLVACGAVHGDAASVESAMRKSHPLLVFPGGHLEVYKRRGEPRYPLHWKQRAGFAKLAVRHGYTIIPTSGIGFGNMLRILGEVRDPGLMKYVFRDSRDHITVPICVPVALETQYVRFGAPIETAELKGRDDDTDAVWAVRERTRLAVAEGLEALQRYRKQDRARSITSGALRRLQALYRGNSRAFALQIAASP
ncbi:Transmembrane protein 68 [Geranomyces michiganensis]|nr:Transmembrane protein 68 [Geranomyces michiganensis]